jgi:UDP-N-acetylglucosamine acyltransferase
VIHPTAVVDPRAEIDPSAEIGPYVLVEGPVRVGARCRILGHAVLTGSVAMGEDNEVHYGAVIGHVPQDVAFPGGESGVRIGRGNVFREHVTVHRGTKPGTDTVIGDRNFFFAGSHAAHNCRVGDDVVVANNSLLAGYVEVGDRSFVSGNCVVHQFVRIGRLAMLRGGTRVSRDVQPFCIVDGTHTVRALNVVGLRRAGMPADEIRALRRAFHALFVRPRNLKIALAEVEQATSSPAVRELVEFVRSSRRGVCFGPRATSPDERGEDGGDE